MEVIIALLVATAVSLIAGFQQHRRRQRVQTRKQVRSHAIRVVYDVVRRRSS